MLEQTYLKKTKFVSFGKVKGSTDLCQKLQCADENMAPKPVVMKNIGENGEKCALIWDKHHYSDLTTANTFFATKRLWRKHRNQDVYRVWDFQLDFECNVFIPKSILKELVFLPFTALEDGRPCCFEGDPFHDVKETSNSFFIINNDGIAAEETKVVEKIIHQMKDLQYLLHGHTIYQGRKLTLQWKICKMMWRMKMETTVLKVKLCLVLHQ